MNIQIDKYIIDFINDFSYEKEINKVYYNKK
jgi:hypothetical protein